ncbi:hypothetical protein ACHAWX_005199 [Stephanocyclus meneghinianus]
MTNGHQFVLLTLCMFLSCWYVHSFCPPAAQQTLSMLLSTTKGHNLPASKWNPELATANDRNIKSRLINQTSKFN